MVHVFIWCTDAGREIKWLGFEMHGCILVCVLLQVYKAVLKSEMSLVEKF